MNEQQKKISELLKKLVGQPCCRQRVNPANINMLSLGFGNKIYHKKLNKVDNYYGEWELGTYNSAWRLVQNGQLLIGSSNKYNSLDTILQRINLGNFVGIDVDGVNISIILDNKVRLDFFPLMNDSEAFHIFLPQHNYIEFSPETGWVFGRSDLPWKPNAMDKSILP